MADWGQVASFLGGGLLTLAGIELTQRRQTQRERDDRQAERDAIKADRRAVFEEEALVGLQNAVADLARCNMEWLMQALRMYRAKEGNPMEDDSFDRGSPDLQQRILQANRDLTFFKVRVLDRRVRDAVDHFHTATAKAAMVDSVAEVKMAMEDATASASDATEMIGLRLRQLYGEA
jgi:hypothetical protein